MPICRVAFNLLAKTDHRWIPLSNPLEDVTVPFVDDPLTRPFIHVPSSLWVWGACGPYTKKQGGGGVHVEGTYVMTNLSGLHRENWNCLFLWVVVGSMIKL